MEIDHFWILDALKDIETYAEIHDQPKIAALISAARRSVGHVLNIDFKDVGDVAGKDEQWFTVVLDELARHCHTHGLTETEGHLLAALDGWASERQKIRGNVFTFPKSKRD